MGRNREEDVKKTQGVSGFEASIKRVIPKKTLIMSWANPATVIQAMQHLVRRVRHPGSGPSVGLRAEQPLLQGSRGGYEHTFAFTVGVGAVSLFFGHFVANYY